MKKYLFLAVAALGLAACAEKGLDNNGPANKGELEQSYVAITLAADDMSTKADDGVYAEGTPEERKVKSAYVFFFNDGNAFPVTYSSGTSTNSGSRNYLEVTLDGDKKAMDNVSDVKDAVLILQNYKGQYPNQIVAVLNWTPEKDNYTLEQLQAVVASLGNDTNGYVMSNAVYAYTANKTIDAVALTAENIAKTPEDAVKNPVKIYVERVAAKVVFSSTDDKYQVGTIGTTDVYAKIEGFELYNDYETSWLLKKIESNWDVQEIGFNWNDVNWFRSYWANSLETEFPANKFAWNTDNTSLNGHVYCGENTRAWTKANDLRTKVIVKAKLVDENGATVEVANWWGNDYIGEESLRAVVANTLKNTYFTSTDGTTFVGLTPDQIKCVARNPKDKNAYEVYFVIADAYKGAKWYRAEANAYKPINIEDLNTNLAAMRPALVYKTGMTYYWTDIKHLGTAGKTAEYGVVRNHVYNVKITNITGYGTPVYNGNTEYIKPEKPADVSSYVAAQINILSWRVVANDYQLK